MYLEETPSYLVFDLCQKTLFSKLFAIVTTEIYICTQNASDLTYYWLIPIIVTTIE